VASSASAEACGDDQFRTVYFDFDESAIRAGELATLAWNQACFDRNLTIWHGLRAAEGSLILASANVGLTRGV
jgi:hypothetical protein